MLLHNRDDLFFGVALALYVEIFSGQITRISHIAHSSDYGGTVTGKGEPQILDRTRSRLSPFIDKNLQRLFVHRASLIDYPVKTSFEKFLGIVLCDGILAGLFDAAPLFIFNTMINGDLAIVPQLVHIPALKPVM